MAKKKMIISNSPAMPAVRIGYGMNYNYWNIGPNNEVDDRGIILTYHETGVRATVQNQLQLMKQAGFSILRTLVWHMHDIGSHRWGVIPSGSGLEDPYYTNIMNFAFDIKNAGFKRWTISMGPMWTNSPLEPNYDSGLFLENFNFLSAVRLLARTYGPPVIKVDIWNEGSPSIYWPQYQQMWDYNRDIWSLYVSSYGHIDAGISSIVDTGETTGIADRLIELIAALQASGKSLPTFWEIHSYFNTKSNLTISDQALTNAGLSGNLILGETSYHYPQNLDGAVNYQGNHPLEEYTQWYILNNLVTQISPPYTVT